MIRLITAALVSCTAVVSTLLSDTGCQCALVKGGVSTPSAGASVAVGCSTKLDWNGAQSQWCLTDQTAGACGTLQPGLGYVDSCAGAGFTAASVVAATTPFYTGQNLSVTWTTTQFAADELIRLTFNGRILATNVSSVAGGASARVTWTGTNQSVVLASLSSPAVTRNTTELITVLQSGLTGVNTTYNGTSIAGTTQVLDDRNITVTWAGVGDAATGNTTITVKSNGGFGGTKIVGLPLSTLSRSITYTLPRTFVPSGGGGGGGTTYIAAISLQGPSGAVYTINSASFSLVAAPTPTPTPSATRSPSTPSYTSSISLTPSVTPSQTPTPTQTPTASLSFGATASNTPTVTPTSSITPSATPSATLTPTPTSTTSLTSSSTPTGTPSQTAAASVDYVGIAAAQSAATAAQTNALVAGLIGGIFAFVVIGLGSYKLYQRYQYRQRRLRGLQATAKRLARAEHIQESASVVGLDPAIYEFTRPKTHRLPQQKPQTPQQRQQDRVRR